MTGLSQTDSKAGRIISAMRRISIPVFWIALCIWCTYLSLPIEQKLAHRYVGMAGNGCKAIMVAAFITYGLCNFWLRGGRGTGQKFGYREKHLLDGRICGSLALFFFWSMLACLLIRGLVISTGQTGYWLSAVFYNNEHARAAAALFIPLFTASQLSLLAATRPGVRWLGIAATGSMVVFYMTVVFLIGLSRSFLPTLWPLLIQRGFVIYPGWMDIAENWFYWGAKAAYLGLVIPLFIFVIFRGVIKKGYQRYRVITQQPHEPILRNRHAAACVLAASVVFAFCAAGSHRANMEGRFLDAYRDISKITSLSEIKRLARNETLVDDFRKATESLRKAAPGFNIHVLFKAEYGGVKFASVTSSQDYERRNFKGVRNIGTFDLHFIPREAPGGEPENGTPLLNAFLKGKDRYAYKTFDMPTRPFNHFMGLMRLPTDEGILIVMLTANHFYPKEYEATMKWPE